MLARWPLRRTLALFIVAMVPVLAVAIPAWCFGSGMW
jgi:hypothetical protein